jgi:hypothetical protein
MTAFDSDASTACFVGYDGIDAYGGRAAAPFPVHTAIGHQKMPAAVAESHPGTVTLQ